RHHRAAGADVAPAVHLVPQGRWERQDIHRFLDVFENRSGRNFYWIKTWSRRLPLRRLAAQRFDQALVRFLHRQAQDRGQARRAARAAGQHAKAPGMVLDAVEEQRGRQALLDVELADRAELEIPVGALDRPQLAQLVDRREPGSQVEGVPAHWWTIIGFTHQ